MIYKVYLHSSRLATDEGGGAGQFGITWYTDSQFPNIPLSFSEPKWFTAHVRSPRRRSQKQLINHNVHVQDWTISGTILGALDFAALGNSDMRYAR